MIKYKNAKGVKGYLLRGVKGEIFFREYDPKDKRIYKDYYISAYDIEIEILDEYIVLKERENKENILDYHPRVYGKEEKEEKSG